MHTWSYTVFWVIRKLRHFGLGTCPLHLYATPCSLSTKVPRLLHHKNSRFVCAKNGKLCIVLDCACGVGIQRVWIWNQNRLLFNIFGPAMLAWGMCEQSTHYAQLQICSLSSETWKTPLQENINEFHGIKAIISLIEHWFRHGGDVIQWTTTVRSSYT